MEIKRLVGLVIFILLSLIFISTLLLAIYFYTSFFKVLPWHDESSRGFQMLGILIFVVPLLAIVSLSFYALGKYYTIAKSLKRIPLFAIAGLSIPYFLTILIQTFALVIFFAISKTPKETNTLQHINIYTSNLTFVLGILIGVGFLIVSIRMILENLLPSFLKARNKLGNEQ